MGQNSKQRPQRARNKFLREKRDQMRKQAKERQEARNQRTAEQQIAKLDAGGYAAVKERARLARMIAEATSAVKITVEAPPEVKEKKPRFKKGKREKK